MEGVKLNAFYIKTQGTFNTHSMHIRQFHIECGLEPMPISELNSLSLNPLPEIV